MNNKETYSNRGAICPHCNKLHDPSDDNYGLFDEGTGEWECHSCSKVFQVSVYVSHSWTCKPLKEASHE